MRSFYKYHTFQWNLPQVQWMNRMYFIVLAHFAEKGETPVLLLEQITYVSEFYIYVFCHEMIRTNCKDSNNKFKIIIQVVASMLLYSLKFSFSQITFAIFMSFIRTILYKIIKRYSLFLVSPKIDIGGGGKIKFLLIYVMYYVKVFNIQVCINLDMCFILFLKKEQHL